ncbi:MAG: hypothetical protein ACRDZN_12465, partial [Acidimicrobiales bacterium]
YERVDHRVDRRRQQPSEPSFRGRTRVSRRWRVLGLGAGGAGDQLMSGDESEPRADELEEPRQRASRPFRPRQ